MVWRPRLLLQIFVTALCFGVVHGAHNITIGSTNTSIVYEGTWGQNPSQFAYDGVHAFSEDRNATASFNFTGVAIYYMAPLWPYTVNTLVSIDSEAPTVINMTDSQTGTVGQSENEPAQVLWGLTGLSNTPHTFVASMWANGTFVVMNALIYTVLDASDIPPSTLNASSTTPPAFSTLMATSQPDRLGKALDNALLGVLCGILVVVVAGSLMFIFSRRRKKQRLRWSMISSSVYGASPSASTSSKSLPSAHCPVQIISLRKDDGGRIVPAEYEAHRL